MEARCSERASFTTGTPAILATLIACPMTPVEGGQPSWEMHPSSVQQIRQAALDSSEKEDLEHVACHEGADGVFETVPRREVYVEGVVVPDGAAGA